MPVDTNCQVSHNERGSLDLRKYKFIAWDNWLGKQGNATDEQRELKTGPTRIVNTSLFAPSAFLRTKYGVMPVDTNS